MAVISSQTDSVMVLEVQTGLTPAGALILLLLFGIISRS